MLELNRISIALPERDLIRDLSVTVAPGQVVAVTGPSGQGKSSLLAYVGGFLPDALQGSGTVNLNGKRIDSLPMEQRRLGVLQQQPLLFPHLNVLENLLFAIPEGQTNRQRRARALDTLAAAGLNQVAYQLPDTLSGGQAARVALLRTLLSEPQALLLDEPFSKLDIALREQIREFVLAQIHQFALPTLLVTHDPEDVAALRASEIKL
ncbi:ATP-binding cassette domain-containing protein [Maribrevibacterium harenarium]|uniref:ATP-binding cassette domain-containing protein n=1 Tax=Maribrevibacterium harenarium TaxID=2589817 RepID=A0A501WDK3_9GAMM|nr:ATP-binding cassette domain-containing protein [Maribrevibacterium harenarium]TPE46565.1 ATP-binding cassette domain-containing protein [Maribrevibacterium harenarium]